MEHTLPRLRVRSGALGHFLPSLGLTLALFLAGLSLAPGASVSERVAAFVQWDANWYREICQVGYRSTVPPTPQNPQTSNVGFFPGYPMACRAVARLFPGLGGEAILLGISLLACWAFFALLLSLLGRSGASGLDRGLWMATILAFPSSFFLILPYAESLFVLCLVAYLAGAGKSPWAGLWGAGMSATRIFGGPLALVPPLVYGATAMTASEKKPFWQSCHAAGMALVGIGGFFIYCQWQFGAWDLYLQTQHLSWGIRPRVEALWSGDRWLLMESFRYGPLGPVSVDMDSFSRVVTVLFSWLAVICLGVHGWYRKALSNPQGRQAGIFLLAGIGLAACYYIALGGGSCRSMVRYLFGPFVCLVLWYAHAQFVLSPVQRGVVRLALPLGILLGGSWGILLLRRFLAGGWVA